MIICRDEHLEAGSSRTVIIVKEVGYLLADLPLVGLVVDIDLLQQNSQSLFSGIAVQTCCFFPSYAIVFHCQHERLDVIDDALVNLHLNQSS